MTIEKMTVTAPATAHTMRDLGGRDAKFGAPSLQ